MNNKNKTRHRIWLSGCLLAATQAVWAYHPISKVGPFDEPYPEYPKVEYGEGDQAKLIQRGEYLAKAGDCLACHTKPGGKSFAGGLAIKTPFGTFYSPNITPDKKTGIGNWTEENFINAMAHGKRPDGSNYYPVFPYLYFSKTSKDDLLAMYAYFQKIPAVEQENSSLSFPYSLPLGRFAMNGWRALYFKDTGEYKYDPNHAPEWNRGAYLVQGLGHCGMCHTPLNIFGAPKEDQFLTGAFVDGYWAPNITGFGLKSASIYEVAEVFTENGQLINNAGPVAGPMAAVNHGSLQHLSKDDQLAIATYLKSVATPNPYSVPPTEHEADLKRGKQVFINACIMCHQGNIASAPAIGDGPGWLERLKSQGLQALYRHTINGYNKMPVRGACVTCRDQDIKAAVDYLLHESLNASQWQDLEAGKLAPKTSPTTGAMVYKENCAVCHDSGSMGAPKIGDKKLWEILLRKNVDKVIEHAVYGKDGSHVRGDCENCSNSEVISAVKYMIDKSSEKNLKLW